ncbi:MAG TPA: ATP-grasp domain-containing protein [Gemmatimonadales bacterium]|nr:ATP-grasp domain-containing protein [Gemmatimonadales bacterium]
MKAVVLYDAGSSEWTQADVAAVMANVNEVRDVLRRHGWSTRLVPVRLGDFTWLGRARRADLVFNLCEGINGHARFEDLVVGTLELTGVPITGCRTWPTTVCHRKHVANTLLASVGVPVPTFVLAQGNRIPADFPLPAIVKPAAEDASVGIDQQAVCSTRKALRKRVAWLAEQFDEVLVQSYVSGREVNVGFVGSRMLPISEIDFDALPDGHWPIVSYAAKWAPESDEYAGTDPVCPARLPADTARRVGAAARQAWEYLAGAEGYGRVDLRIADDGQPYVLEVNPCPDLSSDAGLARMAAAHGWSYDDLVMEIVEEALSRSQRSSAAAALAGGSSVPA